MNGERNGGVDDNRSGTAGQPDAERVDHAARRVRMSKQRAIMVEREHLRQHNAFAPAFNE